MTRLLGKSMKELLSTNLAISSRIKGFLYEASKSVFIPTASLKDIRPIETFDHVTIPEKPKLKFYNKVPKRTRYKKVFKQLIQIRGPSEVANKLKLGQYGIVARSGGYLRHGHFEMMRLTINRSLDSTRMFARWRVEPPSKPITKKGQGQRMGGGKGNVDHYVTPVKANRMILEVGGKVEFQEVRAVLVQVAKKLPFRAEVVTAQSMKAKEWAHQEKIKNNANPWTFEKIARGNYLGISTRLGPYDYKWFGEYR
ncbi:39S ribosomal protein L16, mitochondrial-like [Acanthaster planci]|uniref:Large ribosomal subunit protein uL16m n=1 Tax=Acanthaster planci TaxID=133434 RepID=A0A8B7ZG17_ACAPL|nr:39S ribosomal protein L16, mitochondrial-like [Acanthaster planci]